MQMPLVSIVVPCYKQAEYLAETLDSVLAQTYQNWECIIVNDGSPDNTEEIANGYIAKDNRFKYVWKENGGLSSARHSGILNSEGEFVLPLDADDLIAPTYLEKAMDHFYRFPETKLVYCKADKFGKENGYWDLEAYDYEKFIWNNCIFCTAMFRRADYDQTHGYNVNMIHGYEDWDFWLSLLKKEDLVYRIGEVLFHYRTKERSMLTELSKKYKEDTLIQICKNHPEIYSPYYERIVEYHNRLEEIEILQQELERTRSSRAFRFGKLLSKPFSWLKNHLIYVFHHYLFPKDRYFHGDPTKHRQNHRV